MKVEKKVFTMFTKSAKNVRTIYSENYKETVQNVFFFNKITIWKYFILIFFQMLTY